MAMASLLVKIGADIAELKTGTDKSIAVMEGTSRKIDSIGGTIQKSLIGAFSIGAAAGAAVTAIRSVASFLDSSIKSYSAAEAAQAKLTAALKAAGRASPEVQNQLSELSSEFQKTTVYSDDLIDEMQALFVQIGQVGPTQMRGALTAATDLASGLGIDLREATMLVAKAFAGGGDSLGRLKTILGDAYVEGSGMAGILDAINQKFGGQAQAQIDTYAGKIEQAANAFDNFKEAVGRSIVQDPLLQAALRAATEGLQGVSDESDRGSRKITEWWARLANAREAALAIGYINSVLEAQHSLNTEIESLGRTIKSPKAFQVETLPFPPGYQAAITEARKEWDFQIEAEKKAAAAAEAHSRAIAGLRDQLSGRGTIRAAQDMVTALRGLPPIYTLTDDAIKRVNATMDAAIEVYRAQGKIAPQAMRDLYIASTPALEVINGIGASVSNLGDQIDVAVPSMQKLESTLGVIAGIPFGKKIGEQIDIAIPTIQRTMSQAFGAGLLSDLERSIGGLSHALSSAFTGATSIGSALKAYATGVAKDFVGTALSFIPGIGPVLSQLAGPMVDGFKKLWGKFFGTAGRDAVKEFASSFGGFDALHVKLNELGAEGERLWIKLTQGVGRNNPQQAQAAIDEITGALERHKEKQQEVQEAASASAQAQTDAYAKARDAISALDGEIKKLSDSIAGEAPEEFMGIVEQQTRARIEAITQERNLAANALEETARSAAEGAQQTAKIIQETLDAADFVARIKWEIPELPDQGSGRAPLPGYATGTRGGYVDFGSGTPVMLHGKERIVTEGEALGVDGGTVTLSAPDALALLQGQIVKVARQDASRGGLRSRTGRGRSY